MRRSKRGASQGAAAAVREVSVASVASVPSVQLVSRVSVPPSAHVLGPRRRVIVIGAGVAGLSAAHFLRKATRGAVDVVVLEGRARIGGRIHSVRLRDGSVVECGANFIHGCLQEDNEVLRLAEKVLDIELRREFGGYVAGWLSNARWYDNIVGQRVARKDIREAWKIFRDVSDALRLEADSLQKEDRDRSVADFLNNLPNGLKRQLDKSSPAVQQVFWSLANTAWSYVGPMSKLSARTMATAFVKEENEEQVEAASNALNAEVKAEEVAAAADVLAAKPKSKSGSKTKRKVADEHNYEDGVVVALPNMEPSKRSGSKKRVQSEKAESSPKVAKKRNSNVVVVYEEEELVQVKQEEEEVYEDYLEEDDEDDRFGVRGRTRRSSRNAAKERLRNHAKDDSRRRSKRLSGVEIIVEDDERLDLLLPETGKKRHGETEERQKREEADAAAAAAAVAPRNGTKKKQKKSKSRSKKNAEEEVVNLEEEVEVLSIGNNAAAVVAAAAGANGENKLHEAEEAQEAKKDADAGSLLNGIVHGSVGTSSLVEAKSNEDAAAAAAAVVMVEVKQEPVAEDAEEEVEVIVSSSKKAKSKKSKRNGKRSRESMGGAAATEKNGEEGRGEDEKEDGNPVDEGQLRAQLLETLLLHLEQPVLDLDQLLHAPRIPTEATENGASVPVFEPTKMEDLEVQAEGVAKGFVRRKRAVVRVASSVEEVAGSSLPRPAAVQAVCRDNRKRGQPHTQEDALVLSGYNTLTEYLAQGIDVRLNKTVRTIVRHGGAGAVGCSVFTADGEEFNADACIVTVPLGVLKGKSAATRITFVPPLSETKLEAIDALDMGNENKVIMRFDDAFWPIDDTPYIQVTEQGVRFLSLHHYGYRGVLVAHLCPPWSETTVGKSDKDVLRGVYELLIQMFGVMTMSARRLLEFHVTRWNEDPFAMGAYSFMPVSSTFDHVHALRSEEGCIMFAGEATSAYDMQCVTGGFNSGKEAAADVLELLGMAECIVCTDWIYECDELHGCVPPEDDLEGGEQKEGKHHRNGE